MVVTTIGRHRERLLLFHSHAFTFTVSAQAAVSKYHKRVDFQQTHLCHSLEAGVKGQGASMAGFC